VLEPQDPPQRDGDSSDILEGPIGDAHLVDPTTAEDRGADVGQLPGVDFPPDVELPEDAPAR
jgi:hypothetical protein